MRFAGVASTILFSIFPVKVFDNEAESAPAVFHFLIDFAKKNRIRLKQISEVLNILMASPAWAESFNASPMHVPQLRASMSRDSVKVSRFYQLCVSLIPFLINSSNGRLSVSLHRTLMLLSKDCPVHYALHLPHVEQSSRTQC